MDHDAHDVHRTEGVRESHEPQESLAAAIEDAHRQDDGDHDSNDHADEGGDDHEALAQDPVETHHDDQPPLVRFEDQPAPVAASHSWSDTAPPDLETPLSAAADEHEPSARRETSAEIPGGDNVEEAPQRHEDDGVEPVEHIGGDAMDETPRRAIRGRRQYKIQEVIKRRQVLLVQVVKEERGNKGAALTTYLSLAGRYSVLMPNTARGGGISRKITSTQDRDRMREIADELEVPDGMGVILRTAGAARTMPEIKRDFEYLLRMWETVRETTLSSSAPTLVYEEGSLIKRAIRDLYSRDVDEIVVAGDQGYREAKDFMKLLMPSHADSVRQYRDSQPIFAKAGIEAQLDAMFSNQVTLKSGGYIVINQTEALVAIDVNSGRSTREHNIEDTALRTNVEAADEIARQLRLRDLAGLIVVDFIDMEEMRNNRNVERRMKDALKNDRARIQVGRISHFGLLEMSRQRIRSGVIEGSTVQCPHCMGAGVVRSTSSVALHVLRVIEDALIRNSTHDIVMRARTPVALYILNQKRAHLRDLEERFGVAVLIEADDSLTGATSHTIERGEAVVAPREPQRHAPQAFSPETLVQEPDEAAIDTEDYEGEGDAEGEAAPGSAPVSEGEGGEGGSRRRRRRRRRRGGEWEGAEREGGHREPAHSAGAPAPAEGEFLEPQGELESGEPAGEEGETAQAGAAHPGEREPRGEGRRGRRRRSRRPRFGQRDFAPEEGAPQATEVEASEPIQAAQELFEPAPFVREEFEHEDSGLEPSPQGGTEPDRPERVAEAVTSTPDASAASAPEPAPSAPAPSAPVTLFSGEPSRPPVDETPRPRRSGWWQKAKMTLIGE
jgi:ribonuclease E